MSQTAQICGLRTSSDRNVYSLFVGSSTGTESEVRSKGGSGNSFRSGNSSDVGVPEKFIIIIAQPSIQSKIMT
jgi:hypothetical protein